MKALDAIDQWLSVLDGPPSVIVGNSLAIAKFRAVARRANQYVERPVEGLTSGCRRADPARVLRQRPARRRRRQGRLQQPDHPGRPQPDRPLRLPGRPRRLPRRHRLGPAAGPDLAARLHRGRRRQDGRGRDGPARGRAQGDEGRHGPPRRAGVVMATRTITAPDPGFTGTRAGVVFRDGVARSTPTTPRPSPTSPATATPSTPPRQRGGGGRRRRRPNQDDGGRDEPPVEADPEPEG